MLREKSSAAAIVLVLGVALGCGGTAPGAGLSAPPNEGAGATAANDGSSAASADSSPAGTPKDVDCGDFSTCAVASDGLVRCWGRDKRGELGDGAVSGERARRGVIPGIGKVRKVALASQFGCAILEDRTVKCWGTGRISNDGKVHTDAKPTLVAGVEGAEDIVASGAIACARHAKGTSCWGAEEKTIGIPPKTSFKQIAAGFIHACGLDTSGGVTCWGSGDWNTNGAYGKPATSGALAVATGDRHACVIAKDRSVQCWGTNDAGQLGLKPDMEIHRKPAPVPGIAGVVKIATGEASTCALLGDGTLRCWGSNGEGELGLGMRSPDERPAKVSALADVEHMCLASAHGCALTKQSKIFCWGSNAYGQIGDGTKERRSAPTAVLW